MKINFSKYEGTGNDFIVVDNRDLSLGQLNKHAVSKLCNRRFGIGADGLMMLQDKAGFDFEMIYHNADGNPGSMCGNGGRCIVSFAKKLGTIDNETRFMAADGLHYAKITDEGNYVSLQMADVEDIQTDGDAWVLDTGSPHYVSCVKNLTAKNVYDDGKVIRYNRRYAEKGINVNFVEEFADHYFVRTYERGVEGETYACGTGVTAVAVAMAKQKNQTGDVKTDVRVTGGELNVRFNYDGVKFASIFLEGPATFVYEGFIEV